MEEIDADIYCFQEFFHHSGVGVFETKDLLRKKLKTRYIHEVYTTSLQGKQHYGIATLSKYPILNKGQITFEGERSNICIFTDLKVGRDTLRVYNAHVASIRFTDSNYKFLEELQNDTSTTKPAYSEGLNIIERLNKAYRKRASQVSIIIAHMQESPYRNIFCGDLNDTPVSYSYGELSRQMEDSFRESGWGIGNTYIGKFPSFRIDYIFHDRELHAGEYETHAQEVSDHHAISCRLYME